MTAASAPPPATQSPVDRRTFVRATLDLGDVLLRPWGPWGAEREEVLDGLVSAAADPLIALWNPLATADRAAATAWLDARDQGWERGVGAAFAVLAADGALLGSVSVRWVDRADGLAMTGYWTLPEARGRRVATRATAAATAWAFATAGARRIEIAHAVGNEPSCRLALRCGYPAEGTLRDSHLFGDGAYHDEHLHARLAADPEPAGLAVEATAYTAVTSG
ncbi:GNAT family N-acetyltransferase [Streptomyces sp. AK02-01A]|uniref:GNAT family N-acetyltransferase n=1 Tax=Streptomyces sp. AK02-01A TaxID=3028648 RepID=UPI0029B07B75|nr:GNAT family N-acetyltransferase [Streptomyces sp. AK02-01A]MDX3854711.1 GNAT family N-acetyltransferase [Streptomyces sp. AK02-01A]